jgi:hypothetical protein
VLAALVVVGVQSVGGQRHVRSLRPTAAPVHVGSVWRLRCESATVGGAPQGLGAVLHEQLVVPGYHALRPPLANLFGSMRIPGHADHRFQRIVITDSNAS